MFSDSWVWGLLVHCRDNTKKLNVYSLLGLSTLENVKCYPTMTKVRGEGLRYWVEGLEFRKWSRRSRACCQGHRGRLGIPFNSLRSFWAFRVLGF